MPEPLAMPVMAALPDRRGTLAILGRVSVVRMASAKQRKCPAEDPALANRGCRCELIFLAGRGTPMIPVEEGNTSEARTLSRRAAWAHRDLQSRMPAFPVAQLAFPELTRTARTRPRVLANAARPTSTGAATTRFCVNRAAPRVSAPARISAMSGLPLALIPAAKAENL